MNSTNLDLASSEKVLVEGNELIVEVEKFQSEEMKTEFSKRRVSSFAYFDESGLFLPRVVSYRRTLSFVRALASQLERETRLTLNP
jgi:hypothetical protein